MDLRVKLIESDNKEDRMLNAIYTSPFREKFVEVSDEKFVFPIYFNDCWDVINKLDVWDDDVFVVGHPRSDNDGSGLSEYLQGYAVKSQETSTHHKDHLPLCLLPEQIRNGVRTPKMIHILRNPKDVCTSYYHIQKTVDGYTGTFEEFCELFLAGKTYFGPYFSMIRSYWDRKRKNVLIITYTDLKINTFATVKKIAQFLEKTLSDEEIKKVIKQSSVDTMRKTIGKDMDNFGDRLSAKFATQSARSDFIRFAKDGGHKSAMSPELIQKFDKVIEKELEGTGISFE